MTPVEELRYLILAAQREGNRQLAQALRPHGITPAQAEVLRLLEDRQPLTLSGLGELLVCESGTNPSRLVDRLVSAELVRRVPGEQDRRQVELSLTPAGRRLARKVAAIEDELHRMLAAAGSARELATAATFLRTLVAGQPAGDAVALRKRSSARM
ncbi:DNA-binding MarR family transcriptional regulator [Hamadaea flava]|uniref:MarR family winged helix-turn-helix transcriptional regulator n=1 Tax=Hamadaea flava TaxID=1742688 RepID=A0ABV8LH23_9ACTN|nr:MarR family transcriptional regulator [Hamadaea flava]MCP2324334.1 DNA-binding MarR family transcriptional regulator [Hamadaea flava]